MGNLFVLTDMLELLLHMHDMLIIMSLTRGRRIS